MYHPVPPPPPPLRETLHLPALHYIITLTANYYESMLVEKRSVMNARQWGQRSVYLASVFIFLASTTHDMHAWFAHDMTCLVCT